MRPIKFLAVFLFELSAADLGRLAGVSREAASRWLKGDYAFPRDKLLPIFRQLAADRGLPWEDAWLDVLPSCGSCIHDECLGGCARLIAECANIRLCQDGTLVTASPLRNGNLVPKISQQVLS